MTFDARRGESMNVIKTVDLNKIFSVSTFDYHVLKNINLSINEGEFTGIVGPSGSGKTTLLYCLSSLESITSGNVFINGKDISSFKDEEISDLRKTEIGFVFQFYNLIPNLTAFENVLLAKVIAKTDFDVDQVLEMVGMKEFKDFYPNQLSGGMQQRIAIARALINQPKIIFADEPTGNLDQKSGKEIMDLLQDLNKKENITIVLVTHNEDYLEYCNKIFKLIDGKIV